MKKIGIIEDHTAIREMVAELVQTFDEWQIVTTCGDGRTALEECLITKPDFVVLDVMLPGMNGTEVLRRLKRRLPKVRVLVFSGYQDAPLVRDLVEAGAQGFISKSAPLAELRRGLEIVSSGGTYFSPEVADVLRQSVYDGSLGATPPLQRLTSREREILQLIAESYSTREIAARLDISIKTADNHRTNLMRKLDLHNIASLTRFAIEHHLVEPPRRSDPPPH
ncbi:MAG: hypothetical protein RL648_43 [Verrucomicrobiota bacterium]|jgi:DNA-binding NarL/FixJ family response regulator